MPNAVRIRKATTADFPQFLKLFRQFQDHHHLGDPQHFKHSDAIPLDLTTFQVVLAEPQRLVLVADYGSLVGFSITTISSVEVGDLQFPRTLPQIEAIFVREKYRDQAIAQKLAHESYQWALEKGFTQIATDVWDFSRSALHFFKKQGFTTRSTRLIRELKKSARDSGAL